MKKTNEDGVTLVELLAALVLMSIVGAIIWNTVFISMRYSTTETKKLRLQQEANYVITEIQRYHRQCDTYTLMIKNSVNPDEDSKVVIDNCIKDSSPNLSKLNISNHFKYSALRGEKDEDGNIVLDENNEVIMTQAFTDGETINAKTDDSSLLFELVLEDVDRGNLTVRIPTNISRVKSHGAIGGEQDD